MAVREREDLTKETFLEVVQDHDGWTGFIHALYKKVIHLTKDLYSLEARVTRIDQELNEDGITQETVDSWVAEAVESGPPEEEQMLGERSPHGWHLLHTDCWSWPEVRRLREKITADCKSQGIFKTQPSLMINTVEWTVKEGKLFAPYRSWVWNETGDPDAKPAIAGLDPWSYLPGLQELAGEADDPSKFHNRFIEIHLGGSR